jgi:hypothetical protein
MTLLSATLFVITKKWSHLGWITKGCVNTASCLPSLIGLVGVLVKITSCRNYDLVYKVDYEQK